MMTSTDSSLRASMVQEIGVAETFDFIEDSDWGDYDGNLIWEDNFLASLLPIKFWD